MKNSENPENRKNAFYTNTIKPKEMAFLEKMEGKYPKLKLPCWWRVGDTLRYAYANNFKLERTIEVQIPGFLLTRFTRKLRSL